MNNLPIKLFTTYKSNYDYIEKLTNKRIKY